MIVNKKDCVVFIQKKIIIVAEIISAVPNNIFSDMKSKYSFIYSKPLSKVPCRISPIEDSIAVPIEITG
jgi:hypothetical protein